MAPIGSQYFLLSSYRFYNILEFPHTAVFYVVLSKFHPNLYMFWDREVYWSPRLQYPHSIPPHFNNKQSKQFVYVHFCLSCQQQISAQIKPRHIHQKRLPILSSISGLRNQSLLGRQTSQNAKFTFPCTTTESQYFTQYCKNWSDWTGRHRASFPTARVYSLFFTLPTLQSTLTTPLHVPQPSVGTPSELPTESVGLRGTPFSGGWSLPIAPRARASRTPQIVLEVMIGTTGCFWKIP